MHLKSVGDLGERCAERLGVCPFKDFSRMLQRARGLDLLIGLKMFIFDETLSFLSVLWVILQT